MALALFKAAEKIKGGDLVARLLAADGVEKVFGIIDGTYFGFYASLAPSGIQLVTPRHETSAAHMAGAYARVTGKLGVCMASNGPGVANILPGIAVENAEGNRVLVITSSRREGIIYPDRGGTYQCFPQVDVTRPMTKWSVAVPSIERLAELVRRALRISYEGRPGVVHVDFPESILNGTFELDPAWLRNPRSARTTAAIEPSPDQIAEAVRLLCRAERPLIHAGSGVLHAGASDELHALADQLGATVTTSWAARAAVDERRRNIVPMIFVDAVNAARTDADVVLVLGSRLGETDWWGKPPYWGEPGVQKTIQVDIDGEILGCNRPVELAVRADALAFIRALRRALPSEPQNGLRGRRAAQVEKIATMCRARRAKLDEALAHDGTPMHSAHVARVCQDVFGDDAILVIDGGNTAIWANFFHEVRRAGSVLGTPKMGMLGAGVAQALGAQAACPERPVYCIIGDGAMGFHPQEVETAVRAQYPVVYIVLCDRQWGMVKMNQSFALAPLKTLVMKSLPPGENINADLGEIEWDALARAMGAHGERVSRAQDLAPALRRAIASGKPAVVHVDVDPVKHMWAPNLKTFKDMHEEPGK